MTAMELFFGVLPYFVISLIVLHVCIYVAGLVLEKLEGENQ